LSSGLARNAAAERLFSAVVVVDEDQGCAYGLCVRTVAISPR
jgi:hypothetical protein